MPIYEYRCEACGHQLEALQKIADEPLSRCPSCGEHALKKLISAAGFVLKGTGWYETDFKGSKKKPAEQATGTQTKKSTDSAKSGAGGKSDAKAS